MRKLALADLRAGLAQAERDLAEFESLTFAERVARAERWLDEPGAPVARERFGALARELAGNLDGAGDPPDWARVGGFWHLAGDERAAAPWLKRVVKERRWPVDPHVLAGAHYLLGDLRKAAKVGGEAAPVLLAEVARSGAAHRLTDMRERLVAVAMDVSSGPHQVTGGDPLTAWDWVEESFTLESRLTGSPVPSHAEMLERCGVLTDEPMPGPPLPLSPPAHPEPADPEPITFPTIEFVASNIIEVELADDLFVEFRKGADDAGWGGRVAPDSLTLMEVAVPPSQATWQGAAGELAAWLDGHRDGHGAAQLRRLIQQHP